MGRQNGKGISKDEICNSNKLSQKKKTVNVRESIIGHLIKGRGKERAFSFINLWSLQVV